VSEVDGMQRTRSPLLSTGFRAASLWVPKTSSGALPGKMHQEHGRKLGSDLPPHREYLR
jgi:hypothetical protein